MAEHSPLSQKQLESIITQTDEVESLLTSVDTKLQNILTKFSNELADYKISDIDADASPNYYGFIDKDGNWYILKETILAGVDTYKYFAGNSGYTTNWTNRVSLSYDYFYNIF